MSPVDNASQTSMIQQNAKNYQHCRRIDREDTEPVYNILVRARTVPGEAPAIHSLRAYMIILYCCQIGFVFL